MKCVIDQYAHSVTDFSSQYGSVGSISYVASNLIGGPTCFPEYGDFSAGFSLRTYGSFWDCCSSTALSIPGISDYCSTAVDFVDLTFEVAVQPIRVDIYEIFNPGSVIRVWASSVNDKWVLLWAGKPCPQPAIARIFSPPIKQPKLFINKLRIEFDQQCQEYYSAYDAVLLVGSTHSSPREHSLRISSSVLKLGMPFSLSEEDILTGVQFLLSEDLKTWIENLIWPNAEIERGEEDGEEDYPLLHIEGRKECKLEEEKAETIFPNVDHLCSNIEDNKEELDGGYFSLLPEELLSHILKLLDLQTLSHLACTCKTFNKNVKDPLLYQKLNLKKCWWLVNKDCLSWLAVRCSQLKALDFSWCGSYDSISSQDFMEFINYCGHNLSILYLNNCHFMDNYCLYIIANTCVKLEAFSLSGCQNVDQLGFGELKKLENLTLLDLTRTRIEFRPLHIILQHIPRLTHLCLDNCTLLDMDEVTLTLASFNSKLVSLSAWKTKGLTSRGLKGLAHLHALCDLDLGWALSGTVTEGLKEILQGCPQLRKLFLTALRTLVDQDLNFAAKYGQHLQQIDVMGTRNITPEAVLNVLRNCQRLNLLDVSYCEQITRENVRTWVEDFPSVAIKGGGGRTYH